MAYYGSGPRPPGMASPAPSNNSGAGAPPGWKAPYGLVSGYPVQPGTGNVLPWTTWCVLYPFACPSNWRSLLNEPAPVARRAPPPVVRFHYTTTAPAPRPTVPPPPPVPRPAPTPPPAPPPVGGCVQPPAPRCPAGFSARWNQTACRWVCHCDAG